MAERSGMALAVATRNDPAGLFFTLNSALLSVRGSALEGGLKFSVYNDSDDIDLKRQVLSVCERMGVSEYSETVDGFYSNHRGRNEAVRQSPGEFTVLADSHVLFAAGFFSEYLSVLRFQSEVGLIHSPFTCGGLPLARSNCFYNMAKFDRNLHGSFSHRGMGSEKPVPVALAPHAAYGFRTAQWLEYGGYLDECSGNGGGEPYVGLKYWMLGSSAWITPRTGYIHYSAPTLGTYGRSRRQWRRNHAATAFALGGYDVGLRYAKRLGWAHEADVLWKMTKVRYEKLAARAGWKFDELLDHWRAGEARPFVKG